jgi:hypothetical protein
MSVAGAQDATTKAYQEAPLICTCGMRLTLIRISSMQTRLTETYLVYSLLQSSGLTILGCFQRVSCAAFFIFQESFAGFHFVLGHLATPSLSQWDVMSVDNYKKGSRENQAVYALESIINTPTTVIGT